MKVVTMSISRLAAGVGSCIGYAVKSGEAYPLVKS